MRGFDTLAIHGGGEPNRDGGTGIATVSQNAAFAFRDAAHAASVFAGEEAGYVYSRLGNPTVAAFEERIARLEGADAAIATASGMAAIQLALLALLRSGEEVIANRHLFGGTFKLLAAILPRYGIRARFVDGTDMGAWEEAVASSPTAKAVFIETPGNPSLRWVDVPAVARLARERGLRVVVDNTFSTPYLFRPLEHGADVVVESATKYINGHGSALGGAVAGSAAFVGEARRELFRETGPTMAPWHAFLFLVGLETLSLRMERHCANALAVARWLADHPRVAWVSYPGLPDHPDHALARRLSPRGGGGIVTFGVKGGEEASLRVISAVRLCTIAANLGDARSLIIHPASTTHGTLTPREQRAAGVTPDLIRLSVGLETADDIIADLDQALRQAG